MTYKILAVILNDGKEVARKEFTPAWTAENPKDWFANVCNWVHMVLQDKIDDAVLAAQQEALNARREALAEARKEVKK